MDNRKISVCIPTFQRTDMVIEAFEQVHDDPRVDQITIIDDCSSWEIHDWLRENISKFHKVYCLMNTQNLGCYQNKAEVVKFAKNDWVCLWDSDNIFSPDYLDKIFEIEWHEKTIYTPSFAKPHFDFRNYQGQFFDKHNIAEYIDKPLFEVCLNACNYFVNKNTYLSNYDTNIEPMTSDSITMIRNHFNNDGKLYIVPGMEYIHRVHPHSHYQNNVSRTTPGYHESVLQSLREMK